MSKDWRKIKEEIEKEIDKIWWEEPVEVTMSKMGVFPGGAGVDEQVFGNLYFQLADTQGMGWWTAEPAMRMALNDPLFTLEHCKRMWKYMTEHMALLMGEVDPPKCNHPWLNLPKITRFCKEIIDSFPTIKSKEEFRDILWSWFNYVNCLNRWFALIFPWHLGKMFPLVTEDKVKRMAKFHGLKVEE